MDKYPSQLKLIEYNLQLSIKPGTPIETRISRLTNSLVGILRLLEQLTIVEPTQTVPTTEVLSDADPASHPDWMDYIGQTTQPLSLSDQVDTKSGLVGQNSECVHQWEYSDYDNLPHSPKNNWGRNWCMKCGALWQSGKILVPAVQKVSSTLAKRPSSASVENSVKESVKSQSKKWTVEEHISWGPAAQPQYGITDGTYHILLPKEETHSMAEQHAKYLTERHY